MVGLILLIISTGLIVAPLTAWFLNLNVAMSGMNDRLEALSVANSEWQRLEHMSLDELEANRENYKTPYNVGEKFKVGVTLGEQGFFDEGKCNALTGTYAGESANCFKDTILTVFDADGNSLYTTRSLPLSAGSGSDNFPEGTILPYTGDLADIPKGWVLCDGNNGTPDLRGKFLEGTVTTTGEFKEAGLPNITGKRTLGNGSSALGTHYGAFYYIGYYGGAGFAKYDGNWGYWYGFDAELGRKYWHQQTYGTTLTNTIYGNSPTVQPSSFTVFYIMKTNTDFHYNHTNGFVSPDYYTKDEVDSLLNTAYKFNEDTYLPLTSKKYVHNVTENNTLAMGYNDNFHIVQMYVDNTERTALPIGTILPYVGKIADIPTGWYVCDGTNGTPKLFGRVLQSYDETHNVGDFVEAGLPNITGKFFNYGGYGGHYAVEGATYYQGSRENIYMLYGEHWYGTRGWLIFDASRSNPIYGNSQTVQPPAYIVCYIIKMG